jgi:hypothetical protein
MRGRLSADTLHPQARTGDTIFFFLCLDQSDLELAISLFSFFFIAFYTDRIWQLGRKKTVAISSFSVAFACVTQIANDWQENTPPIGSGTLCLSSTLLLKTILGKSDLIPVVLSTFLSSLDLSDANSHDRS